LGKCPVEGKKKIERALTEDEERKKKYSYLATHGYYRNSPW